MPEVVQTWLRLSYLKVAFYAVQLFWSLGELVQDAAAFTEDFLQPLFQPIVALSVRERGRRGRSEIMVVNILKKTWGGQLCTGYEWKDGGTEIFSYESSNLLRVSSTQTGLLTRGMSPHFYLNIHVVRQKKNLYRQYLSNFVRRLFEPKSSSEKRFISAIHC